MASTVKDLVKTATVAAGNHQASITAAQQTAAAIAAQRAATARPGTVPASGPAAGGTGAR